jgi:hypothetical protein
MKPELIEALKEAAATNDQKTWQRVEKAVKRALKSKKTRSRRRNGMRAGRKCKIRSVIDRP